MAKRATKIDPSQSQFQLTATLCVIRPAIWRRLVVPGRGKLPRLHTILQHAFGWTDSDLHAFRIRNQSYEVYDPESWGDCPGCPEKHDEDKFRLCDLLHANGDRLSYLYDFGNDWELEGQVENMLPATRRAQIMACTQN